jgi:hypothetical protein
MRVEWGYRMDTRDGWWAAGCPSALLKAPVRWSLFCLPSIVMQRGWTIPYQSRFLCEEISSELCLDWRVSQESTDEVCWNPLCSELGHYLRLSHLSLSLPGLSNLAWAFGCLEVEGLGNWGEPKLVQISIFKWFLVFSWAKLLVWGMKSNFGMYAAGQSRCTYNPVYMPGIVGWIPFDISAMW